MDACEFLGLYDGGLDAFVEHPAPFEFVRDDAHATGPLAMPHSGEVFGQAIVMRNEHVTASILLVASLLT
jgi:hypothetical protein